MKFIQKYGKKYRNKEFSFEELGAQKYYAEKRKKDLARRGRLFCII